MKAQILEPFPSTNSFMQVFESMFHMKIQIFLLIRYDYGFSVLIMLKIKIQSLYFHMITITAATNSAISIELQITSKSRRINFYQNRALKFKFQHSKETKIIIKQFIYQHSHNNDSNPKFKDDTSLRS